MKSRTPSLLHAGKQKRSLPKLSRKAAPAAKHEKQAMAVIAYLQRLGTDLTRTPEPDKQPPPEKSQSEQTPSDQTPSDQTPSDQTQSEETRSEETQSSESSLKNGESL